MQVGNVNADWRLRSDGATKSNRIEKRQAGKWTPLASFVIEMNACKPPPVKEQEPPPETTEAAPATRTPGASGTLSLPSLRGEPVKRPKK